MIGSYNPFVYCKTSPDLLPGEAGTGKSCLLHHFTHNRCTLVEESPSLQTNIIFCQSRIIRNILLAWSSRVEPSSLEKSGSSYKCVAVLSSRRIRMLYFRIAMGHCWSGKIQVLDANSAVRRREIMRPFRSVTRSYYRGAAGAILVYDITKFVHCTLGFSFALI